MLQLRGRRWYYWAWRALRLALIVYLLVLLAMMFLEERLIFIPLNFADDDWQPTGLTLEEARFEAADGTQLYGWYVPHPRPCATVLFSHGNAGNITHRADLLRGLHYRSGVSVLIYDYRGYGQSQGKPNEAGVLADARAARAWLARREGIAETDVVQMGESLGGGVAVDLAAADGARAVVLVSTFTSLPDVAARHYPWLPVRWLMKTRMDSVAKIGRYNGPLLQFHGNADTIIPYENGQRLFEAANEPKQFVTLPRHDHNDPLPPSAFDQIGGFLQGVW